ncbi:PAS domain S-box protein [Calothrix sp. PCC 7507]|uniref:PAS domain S-box protein n=1 Tax=Calothrix sp. PCC 7507 TaxID=99598 RepID=UPI00029F046E|nr:PAS domain S-box protein [Calothrix sp. PCC 7507]AFY34389.1 multi-sensor hybrid histidine kinase [Calothrix sp. PCC 7507]
MPHINNSQLRSYGIAVLVVAVALALMLMLDTWLGMSSTPFLLFFSAVMVSAWYGGWKSGLLATFLSVILSHYFFLAPTHHLTINLPNLVRLGLFASQGLLFSFLCEALRTAKRRTEVNLQKLKVSEARFRLALTSSDIFVFQQDRDLRYQWIHNSQGEDVAEALGKSDYELFPPTELEQLIAIKQKTLETGVSNREKICLTVRGEVRYYDLLVEPLKEMGDVQGIICVAVNITQLKQTEQALRESEAKFRSVVESNMIGIGFWERDGKITGANDALLDVLGYTLEELVNEKLNWVDLTPPEYLSLDEQALTQLQDSPFLTPFAKEYIRKDGSRIPVLVGGSHFEGTVDRGAFFVLDMTERHQAEDALRESEERFRAMFNQAAVGISLVGLDGQFLQINRALCEITGYSAAELMQMNFREITHPDDLAVDLSYARQVLAREMSGYSLEKRYIRKDGSTVWVNLTSSVVWDANGQPKYALGIIEDISDRKQAETAQQFLVETSTLLAASLDYEVTLANVANLAVPTLADFCIVDIFRADNSIQQIAIATADPLKKQTLQELRRRYPPNTEQEHYFLPKLQQGQSVFYLQVSDSFLTELAQDEEHLQLLRSLGVRSLMVIPLYSRQQLFGAISFVTAESSRFYGQADLALANDIARRAATAIDNARLYQETQQAKQAAEKVVSRIMRLQKITAAFSEALTPQEVADVVVSQGIAALGATSGSVVLLADGDTSLKVVKAIGYPQSIINVWTSFPLKADVPIAETVRTGQSIFLENPEALISKYPSLENSVEITNNQAFASIPLIVENKAIGALGLSFATAQVFSQEDRRFMLTLGQQCGQAIARAQLYEAEKTARAEAETANRIKDEFLAVLSHEIRTPLNPILGWAKLLRTRKHDAATTLLGLETIERNAKLQTQLIEDLLDVSRILRGKLSLNIYAVDLKATITAALETVRLAAEAKSIQLQIALSDNTVQVMGDGNRLQQVVWNLLSNAVKFTPTGGRVEVSLLQIENDAQIQVIDTGKGITPEFLPHVFEYFRQADGKTTRVFGGLGLGLAIVRHLVELHGGTIEAESPGEGQGATFKVRLPLLKNANLPDESIESPICTEDSILCGVQILLVDDQADVREFFSFALEQYGAIVKTVASASAALKALAESKPDILLSDIGMPEMDGYMLLREVRKWSVAEGGQIPAIALTAYAGEIDHRQALAAGFQKHIPKPVDPIELAVAIANLLGRK